MSQLRSVLDEMSAFDDENLTSEEIAADITELAYARQVIDVLMATKTKAFANRGGHAELGYPSPTAFLKHRARLSGGHAKQIMARANARDRAPAAFRAWADGRLSTDQTRHLFAAAESVPDAYPYAERQLLEVVEGLSVADTARAVEYWRQSVDGPGVLDAGTQMIRRGVSLSETAGGMRRVDGWLTSTAGEALETALTALMPPPAEGDTRTPRERRHDALEDLCRDWLDHADTPVVGGEKPHMMVLTDLDALQGIAGGAHETLNGDIVDIETLRMIACDCSVSRIILGPGSQVLDIGRKTRVWTPAQRQAIIARDRHCQGFGCDRGPRWCDIHHIDHWADHGNTDIDKGVLLCRWHHTKKHINLTLQRRRLRTKG